MINSSTIGSKNAFTATSGTGQFAALCSLDGTYAIYVTDADGNYCYGQFTIKIGASNKWETTANSDITYNMSNAYGTLVFRGGTAPYTAYVVRQTYTPSNATLETLNSSLGVIVKETTTTGGSVTFKFTGNRYTAILMIQSNTFSGSGIYGLIFKKGAGSSIKSLAGNESLPTIDSNGSITFNMVSWSKAVLYTPAGGDFS